MNFSEKQHKSVLFGFFSLLLIFMSCSDSGKQVTNRDQAKGGRMYGGTIRYNESIKPQSFYPTLLNDVTTQHVANQFYESLLRLDPKTLRPLPGIAEKWEVDPSGTVYTFHLRKDVKFHNDACFADGKGRGLTATDVQYSFELLCTKSDNNQTFNAIFKDLLAGADAFYEAGSAAKPGTLECVRVLDPYTIQVRLIRPCITFLELISNSALFSIVPKEAIDKYGINTHIGTGPFVLSMVSPDTSYCILTRNPDYYRKDKYGNQLPLLDSIHISFINDKNTELDLFQKEGIDFSWGLTADAVRDFMPQAIEKFRQKPPVYTLSHNAEMSTQFYNFNLTRPPFNDRKVRLAFSHAIDRNRLIEDALGGEAYGPGINGVCPSSLPGYVISDVKGYDYNPELAKQLLAEAGYPNGKGFPTVRLAINAGRSRNTMVATEIQRQLLEVLNVNMEVNSTTFAQKQLDAKYARSEMYRDGWTADYPSPQSFLALFYGRIVPDSLSQPSYPNVSRYRNADFDNLFDSARLAKTQEEANTFFLKAEQIMMADAPILVLWYEESYLLAYSHLQNFVANPMRSHDFSEVFIKPQVSAKATSNKDTSAAK
jgi:peptide/nickel transport system substrate-binding protein